MDAVKAKSTIPVQATESRPKQATQEVRNEAKPDESAVKKAADNQPKPTTNAQGEKLGQRLNVVA